MALHHVHKDIDADRELRIVKVHRGVVQARFGADADSEIRGLHRRLVKLEVMEVFAAAPAGLRELVGTDHGA